MWIDYLIKKLGDIGKDTIYNNRIAGGCSTQSRLQMRSNETNILIINKKKITIYLGTNPRLLG